MEHRHTDRKRITIERITLTTVRKRGDGQRYFCNVCGSEVEAVVDRGLSLSDGEVKANEVAAIAADEGVNK